jgi:hypothetical protein
MTDILSLSCPSCGHTFQITNNMDRFNCIVCGNEYIVDRIAGIVTLKPVIDGSKKVQAGVDKDENELDIVMLQAEIEDLKYKTQAIHRSKSVGERGILVVGFLVILAIILLAFNSTRNIGLFIMVATILIYILLQRENTQEKELDNELKNLTNKLNKKEKESQANHQTISKM